MSNLRVLAGKDTSPVALENKWQDWRWQQKNAYRDEDKLRAVCGGWNSELTRTIRQHLNGKKIQITPYYLQRILDTATTDEITDNPLWRQVVPFWEEQGMSEYDGHSENWELQHEMKTPLCQHKYDNRVILRMTNTCNSYCQFCFEALRTLKIDTEKTNTGLNAFEASLDYIRSTPGIEEVILSGGDPLMLTDQKLEASLAAIRAISEKLLIRIHSRALTFNPFRVTDTLVNILEKYQVNAFGVHVCHPAELSREFETAIRKIRRSVPIVFSNMPFLRGINDDEEILHTLFMHLYRMGVKPYYLYHFMPYSPGASVYKSSIEDAVRIMRKMKRRISNIALPEYVLPHEKGKFTVPLNEDAPLHFVQKNGKRYYRFTNWQGELCEWLDEY